MSLAINETLISYRNFNEFFTRPLKAHVRPICTEPSAIACPVDGSVSQLGPVEDDAIFQAKGHHYSLGQLLAQQTQWIEKFRDGSFSTIYLSPKDYHRIHMPVNGTLKQMTYVPGKLFSVSPTTTRMVPDLFARNERVLCFFETPAGPMAMILVGAMIVGSMETVWHGVVTPPHTKQIKHWHYDSTNHQIKSGIVDLNKGDEMGRFNMGSTVILLFGKDAIHWSNTIKSGSAVEMGVKIAAFLN